MPMKKHSLKPLLYSITIIAFLFFFTNTQANNSIAQLSSTLENDFHYSIGTPLNTDFPFEH